MSNRITNVLREYIAKKESDAKFDSEIKDAENIFLKALEERVKSIVKSRFQITDEVLHSGFVGTSHYAQYRCEDKKTNHNSGSTRFSISSSYPRKYTEDSFDIANDSELDQLRRNFITIKSQKETFKKQIERILNSYNTKTKLVEDIPEFIIYFAQDIKMSKSLVPIEQIMNIRKQLTTFDITKKEDKSA